MTQTVEAKQLTTLAFYGAVVLTAILGYRIVQPFLVEIGWAVVLAICLAPAQARLSRRLGARPSAALLTVLALLVLMAPLLAVAQVLMSQGSHAIGYVDAQVTNRGGPMELFRLAWDWLHQRLPFLPNEDAIVQQLSDRLGALASGAAAHIQQVVGGVLGFVISLAIMLCALYFLLKDAPAVALGVQRLLPFGREENERLLVLVRDIVSTSVTSTLLMAVIQGILGGLMFLLLGVPGALLWGALMGVLATLPAVGATLVWLPTAVWLAVTGSIAKGVVLLLFGVLVLGNVDNVVRTLMLSGKSRMSTLVLIISLLGGVVAFGFIGVILGPVVAAVVTAFVETYTKMLGEDTEAPAAPKAAAAGPEAAA